MARHAALLLGLLLVPSSALLEAQEPQDPMLLYPPPPGFVLADDEWLPYEVVYGDSVYTPAQWPNGVVPYRFSFFILPAQRELFRNWVKEIECASGVDFVEDVNASANDHIIVVPSADPGVSSSAVGYQGGSQALRVWPGSPGGPASHWTSKFTIIHELFHALGFRHEQVRTDRDFFVTINWSNIPSNRHHNFAILTVFDQPTNVGPYDFDSIMHYGPYAFTSCILPMGTTCPQIPGCFTITTNDPANQCRIGNNAFMSLGDAAGLQDAYGPTTHFPDITAITPPVVPFNQTATLTITGTNFYEGSLAPPNGVQGSFVKIDGTSVATTYVDRNTLTVTVPASLTATSSCLQVVVNNQFFGDSMPYQVGVGASATSATSFPGAAPDSNAGWAVAGVGDVDDDGIDDVVSGMPNYPLVGNPGSGLVECRSGANGAVIWSQGFGTDRRAGASLATADFNGDRVLDVVVGCPSFLPNTGRVFVVDGRNGNQLLSVPGVQGDDAFGESVAIAGDLTGDGVPEIVVGAPLINQVRVVDGASGATHAIFNGASFSNFGASVGAGQDMNGNGVPDIAVGAPSNNNGQGQVSLYDGLTQNLLTAISGGAQGGGFGGAVALVPSVTRRAVGSLLVGARGSSSSTGRVQVWDGKTFGSYPMLAELTGDNADDLFGHAVAPAGDLDQDGFHDFLVGAPQGAGNSGAGPGYARLFDGRTLSPIVTYTGTATEGGFGWSVADAGDTNGDALVDVVVGSPFADSGCDFSGLVEVFRPRVGPTQRCLRLSEVRWDVPRGVELTNHGLAPIDLAGWRIRWLQSSVLHETPPLSPYTVQPGESVLVGNVSTTGAVPFPEAPPNVHFEPVLPPLSASPDGFFLALVNPGGYVLDEVEIGPAAGGAFAQGDTGGLSRGLVNRLPGPTGPGAERIWGLDSNSGGDWTHQDVTSMGLENRSSGARGFDPAGVSAVVINEIDDDPDYLEFRNVSGATVDVQGWFVLTRASPTDPHKLVHPWTASTPVPDGGFFVIGDGPPPSEMPPGTPYVDLTGAGPGGPTAPPPLGYDVPAFEVALYDVRGRLIDLVRVRRFQSQLVHNHPRAPSAWDDFGGAAYRLDGTSGACGRDLTSTDTDTGGDWRPIQTRTMGSVNPSTTWAGPRGHDHLYDVRLNEGLDDGLTLIINAGPSKAGHRWTFLFSVAPTLGTGPFFGLGADALLNYLAFSGVPPWFGLLDQSGSARLDVPAGTLSPGFHAEDIFLLQAPSGDVELVTNVITYDT